LNLLLIKNIECAKSFINKSSKSIFLTLDNLSYEFLKSKKKKVIFPSEVLDERIFVKEFNYDKKIHKIISILNKRLFKDYFFYKLKNWKIFDYYYLELKKELDKPIYINEVIKILIKKNKINNIFITEAYFKNTTFIQKDPIENLKYLLNNELRDKIKIKKISKKNYINKNNKFIRQFKDIIINKLKEYYFIIKNKNKKFLFIDFSCNSLLKNYFNPDFLNINYLAQDYFVTKDIKIKNFCYINDNDISKLVYQFYISKKKNLQVIKKKFLLFSKLKYKYKFFCFKYSTSILSIIFQQIAKEKKINKFIWSHGAYGFSKSFGGYKYTDHLLFKNIGHVGNQIKLRNKKVINIGHLKDLTNNKIKKINVNKNKKTILFIQGYKESSSDFYFGYNRKNISNSNWLEIREILLLLKKYANNYNIIFKDAPYFENMKKIISNYISKKIKYVYDDYKLDDLLAVSDCSIFSYASTSFLQATNYKNDILVYEPDLTKKFNKNQFIKLGVYFYKDLYQVKKKLNVICKNEIFYRKDKSELIDKFYFNKKKFKIFSDQFLNK
jgi:hypothetical protein